MQFLPKVTHVLVEFRPAKERYHKIMEVVRQKAAPLFRSLFGREASSLRWVGFQAYSRLYIWEAREVSSATTGEQSSSGCERSVRWVEVHGREEVEDVLAREKMSAKLVLRK